MGHEPFFTGFWRALGQEAALLEASCPRIPIIEVVFFFENGFWEDTNMSMRPAVVSCRM
jgi:hypothetical protein